jgi:carboxyl-terminal processing protease
MTVSVKPTLPIEPAMKPWIKNIALLSSGAIGGVMLTVGMTAYSFMGDGGKFPAEELAAFSRVYGAVKRFYVEPVEDKKLVADAIQGMLSKLDPHSAYMDKQETKSFEEELKGTFVGVGMQIDTEDGYIKVQSPIEGGPAERAGIKAGDLIIKIEDKTTKNMNTSQAVKLLRGDMSTKVTITVSRKGDPLPMVITLVRETIKMANIRSKLLDNDVLYVKINGFIQELTTLEFVEELIKLDGKLKAQASPAQAPKHLILDLRNNGGGLLFNAVGVVAAFLPQDKLVVSIRGRIEDNNKQYSTRLADYQLVDHTAKQLVDPLKNLPAWAKTVPLTVLTNQGTASASEIVAGAFKDYGRAKILGTRTFGKGSVQSTIPLPDGASIKLTMQRYYTPKDISIQAKGIAPDYNVDETPNGNPFAEFISREGDYDRALDTGTKPLDTKTAEEKNKDAEEKLKRLEKLRVEGRKPPEYGDIEKDYQLQQAMNLVMGKPVVTVPEELKKDDTDKNKDGKDSKENQGNTDNTDNINNINNKQIKKVK